MNKAVKGNFKNDRRNIGRGMLLGFVAVFMFSLTLPATRLITTASAANNAELVNPLFIGFGRAVLAAIIAAIILLATRSPLPTWQQCRALLIVSLGVVVGFPVLSAWSMQSVAASHGGVVLGLLPLATVMASRLVSTERPSLGFWLSGLVGSGLVICYSLLEGAGGIMWADLALFAAVVSAALGYAVGGKLAQEMRGWQVICWALLLSLPIVILPAIATAPQEPFALPIPSIISFLYLALFSQLIGFFVWYKALALGGIAKVSQMQLLQPFMTLAVSASVLSEPISAQSYVFAGLIIAIVALGKRMPVHHQTQQH